MGWERYMQARSQRALGDTAGTYKPWSDLQSLEQIVTVLEEVTVTQCTVVIRLAKEKGNISRLC